MEGNPTAILNASADARISRDCILSIIRIIFHPSKGMTAGILPYASSYFLHMPASILFLSSLRFPCSSYLHFTFQNLFPLRLLSKIILLRRLFLNLLCLLLVQLPFAPRHPFPIPLPFDGNGSCGFQAQRIWFSPGEHACYLEPCPQDEEQHGQDA